MRTKRGVIQTLGAVPVPTAGGTSPARPSDRQTVRLSDRKTGPGPCGCCKWYGGIVIALLAVVAIAQAKYSGGTGEPNDPYRIATATDLISLGKTPTDYGKHFILTADIDLDPNLPGGKVFDKAVIAPDTDPNDVWGRFQGTPFTGVFGGNGHTVSHLTITGGGCLGLFGELAGEVRDLGIVDAHITGSGLFIGGLVGENGGTLIQCYSTGSVNGKYGVGGLVGHNSSRAVIQCYSTGLVSGTSGVGGLVGDNYGTISTSYSTGSVSGCCGDKYGNSRIGGLVGDNRGTISTSYSTGWISGTSYVGGLVGFNYQGTISTSYSTGWVSGTSGVGGLVGRSQGTVSTSFWDTTTSGQSTSDGGTGLTTSQMQTIQTFLNAGWDFLGEWANGVCEYWQMPAAGEYPILSTLNGYVPPLFKGAGTIDDPFIIGTPEDLGTVWYRPMACYRLAADIDLSWMKWSMAVIPFFSGRFDGQGHKIRWMTISGEGYLGLFGSLTPGAAVLDLGLEDMKVTGTGLYIGSLVGFNSGTISTSYSSGSVNGSIDVGGLVGRNEGTVSNSYSMVSVSGKYNVGGLVGLNFGFVSISNTYSTGPVSGSIDVGGLVGYNDRGTVSTSFWDKTTSKQTTSAGCTGKTTSEMQTAKTFLDAGWDFVGETANGTEDTWWIKEGNDYPRLWWESDEASQF